MPNTKYRRGYATERKTMQLLKERGYDLVARTAGSHGKFDVVAVDVENKRILLVQCKRSKDGSFPHVELPPDASYLVEFRTFNYQDRVGFTECDGEGSIVE